jgi:hypothetical protein
MLLFIEDESALYGAPTAALAHLPSDSVFISFLQDGTV